MGKELILSGGLKGSHVRHLSSLPSAGESQSEGAPQDFTLTLILSHQGRGEAGVASLPSRQTKNEAGDKPPPRIVLPLVSAAHLLTCAFLSHSDTPGTTLRFMPSVGPERPRKNLPGTLPVKPAPPSQMNIYISSPYGYSRISFIAFPTTS